MPAASANILRGHESQKILFADGKEGRQAIGSNLLTRNSGEMGGMLGSKNTLGTRSGPLMFSNPAAQMSHYSNRPFRGQVSRERDRVYNHVNTSNQEDDMEEEKVVQSTNFALRPTKERRGEMMPNAIATNNLTNASGSIDLALFKSRLQEQEQKLE